MIAVRRSAERFHSQRGKLSIWSTFGADERAKPLAESFGGLAALEEMRLPPGGACTPYRRSDAAVLTYVHRGMLAQENAHGCSAVMHAGEFHLVSAAHGVPYKEANASQRDRLHFFRISLEPVEGNGDGPHEQRSVFAMRRRNALCAVATSKGGGGALRLNRDAVVFSGLFDEGHHVAHPLGPERRAWVHVVHGSVLMEDTLLTAGDGAGIAIAPSAALTAQEVSEILLIDLAPTPPRGARP